MSPTSARARVVICLLSCFVALAGCQDASKLVAPDVEPSLDLDGGFTWYADPEMMQGVFLEVPGGYPQDAYVTYPYTETITPVAFAETYYQYVYVVCMDVGVSWLKVFTGNGYWKIYELTCVEGPPPVPV